jgi:hypothetical protein
MNKNLSEMSSIEKTRITPYYCIDNEKYFLNYCNGTVFILDESDWKIINNFEKTFRLYKDHEYPSYKYNNKNHTLLEFIFKFNIIDNIYYFKNNNNHDLRRENVICYPQIYKTIIEKYDIIDFIQGHFSTLGQSAYKIKNCLWKIRENDKIYLLMYCELFTLCKLCEESYKKILEFEKTIDRKLTWYKCRNGYIQTHNPIDGKIYYIHQIIMNYYGKGQGTKNISIDHIDRNPLNNTIENLRLATREEQEQNSKGIMKGTKRARKNNAKPLPEGITQDMMSKYVNYYHEFVNKEQTRSREFFKVEKHPKLDKIWIGTKSNKLSILDKLKIANKVVDDLENDIYPTNIKLLN